MDWLQYLPTEKLILFTLILTRVSGLVMTAPVYGTPDIPVQVRALFAFALALLVTPSQWLVSVQYPGTMVNYLVVIGSELLIGLVLGLGIALLFAGIDAAGQMIGQSSGLLMAEIFDPTQGDNVSLLSRLLYFVAVAVFVCIGGHRMVMGALLDTFQAIPPGSAAVPGSLKDTFTHMAAQSLLLGIRAAAPVMLALLLANLVLGLIARTLPQLNVLVLGFGINSLLTAGVLTVSLGAAAWVFQDQVEPTVERLMESLIGRP
jgi:flagellar biosynthetic protein FliR